MKDSTEIICVIDRSGSMETIKKEAIGGFNAFLEEQKKLPGDANLSVVLFDHEYSPQFSGPLADAKPFDASTYQPRGTTALLDAVGRTIDDTGKRLAALAEQDRPNKVIMLILTDGQENASKDYQKARVKELIEQQRSKYNWEFVFLAANQDAFAEGGQLGIASCVNFTADAQGTQAAYANMTRGVTSYRLGGQYKQ